MEWSAAIFSSRRAAWIKPIKGKIAALYFVALGMTDD